MRKAATTDCLSLVDIRYGGGTAAEGKHTMFHLAKAIRVPSQWASHYNRFVNEGTASVAVRSEGMCFSRQPWLLVPLGMKAHSAGLAPNRPLRTIRGICGSRTSSFQYPSMSAVRFVKP